MPWPTFIFPINCNCSTVPLVWCNENNNVCFPYWTCLFEFTHSLAVHRLWLRSLTRYSSPLTFLTHWLFIASNGLLRSTPSRSKNTLSVGLLPFHQNAIESWKIIPILHKQYTGEEAIRPRVVWGFNAKMFYLVLVYNDFELLCFHLIVAQTHFLSFIPTMYVRTRSLEYE